MGYLQKGIGAIKEEIFVIKTLHKPLLGRPAIRALNLLRRVGSVVQDQSVLEPFSSVFEGLGKLNYSSKSFHSITGTS